MSDVASEAERPMEFGWHVLGSGHIRLGDASLPVINSPRAKGGCGCCETNDVSEPAVTVSYQRPFSLGTSNVDKAERWRKERMM